MTVVVDTNVVAYLPPGHRTFAAEARNFGERRTNHRARTLAGRTRERRMDGRSRGCLSTDEGHRRLDFASRLRLRSVPIGSLWQSA